MSEAGASERVHVGLCVDCAHARRLVGARGSVFYRCDRAATDTAYAPYPPLPVVSCPGHASRAANTLDRDESG